MHVSAALGHTHICYVRLATVSQRFKGKVAGGATQKKLCTVGYIKVNLKKEIMLPSSFSYITWIKPKPPFCTHDWKTVPCFRVPTGLEDHRVEHLKQSLLRSSTGVRFITSQVIMADYNLTSLARALSQPQLDLTEGTTEGTPRSIPLQPSRRRKLSSCNSVESLEPLTSPITKEARVLVINTGGTIGMTLHDNGKFMFLSCTSSNQSAGVC